MQIRISEHFTYKKLFRFVSPSIVMMFFTVIYGMVNGLAVSNIVGKTSFAAINLIIPLASVLTVFGFMFGSGGAALIAKALGENQKKEADGLFSATVIITVICGFVLAIVGQIVLPIAAELMGAEGELLEQGLIYGRTAIFFLPASMLQYMNQYILPTAEKSKLGMKFTIAGGLSNALFVVLFVWMFDLGVMGAALANGVSQVIGGIVPLSYFLSKRNDSILHFTKPLFRVKDFIQMCINGSSELVTNLSLYLVGILFNFQLMNYLGENGVAAFGVVMYINMIFISIFNGYSIGVSPLVGYNYGARNHGELKNLFKRSIKIIIVLQVILTVLAILTAEPLSMLFVGYDAELLELTTYAFRMYAVSFLFMGMSIFGSAFFTALNNGKISALISFLRTLLFQSVVVMFLPMLLGINGIWLSVTVSEILAVIVTISCFAIKKKEYQYI